MTHVPANDKGAGPSRVTTLAGGVLLAIGLLSILVLLVVIGLVIVVVQATPELSNPSLAPPCLPTAPRDGAGPIAHSPRKVTQLGTLCDSSKVSLVQDIAWHESGWLAAGRDQEVTWWAADGSTQRGLVIHSALTVEPLPDGSILAGTDQGNVEVWRDGVLLRTVTDHRSEVRWVGARPGSPQDIVSVASRMPFAGDVYWASTGDSSKLAGVAWCGAWRPDGKRVALCQGSLFSVHDPTGSEVARRSPGASWIYQVAWAPGRTDRFAVAGDNMGVVVTDTRTGKELAVLSTDGTPRDLAWSPDGSLIAIGTWGGSLWLLDSDGNQLARWDGKQGRIQSVAWSADGTWIATGGDGGLFRIWGVP